ncbi:hypothetical protein GCM10010844_43890 [Deinococcus radiotolerans]|uniref:Uncharacterized protein n=2 Tax=Deinococcus radiotolerans TaxID=1309407 RepID=A0ABQ2FRY3_9DEIO|nr:hypothetical protein GCM10010844_43890 [Deinococcus radiotolerans]
MFPYDAATRALVNLQRKDIQRMRRQRAVLSEPTAFKQLHPNHPDQIGRLLIGQAEPQLHLSLTAFLMTAPEAGLTFFARTLHGVGRAAMVTVTHEVLQQQGRAGAEPALTYLLKVAQLGLLPDIVPGEHTPLIGVWRVQSVDRQIHVPA